MGNESDWFRSQALVFSQMRELPTSRKTAKRLAKLSKVKKKRRKLYLEYINSPRWKAFRAQIVNERGRQREMCGIIGKVQLHHPNYERLGRELDIDIQLLYRPCHMMAHDLSTIER